MSETTAVGTVPPPDRIKLGTVGKPVGDVELKIADDGEILIRGSNIMVGYRNQPEKTAETIDAQGWLATGDVGEIDGEGYLRIVDRKKELIINAAGNRDRIRDLGLLGVSAASGQRLAGRCCHSLSRDRGLERPRDDRAGMQCR